MAGEQFAQEGDTVQLKDGTVAVVQGGQLVAVPGGARSAGGGGKKQSAQAQKFLNDLSTQAIEAGETRKLYEQADKYLGTLKPGPYRGRFLDAAIPEENGGFFDTLGAILIGGPARLTGAVTPKEVDAYQGLKRLQSEQVLGKQLLQKGPQTESDAARLQLTELSPSKSEGLNRQIASEGITKSDRIRARSIFYNKFANLYGQGGTTPEGYTADQIWSHAGDRLTRSWFGKQSPGKPSIKILSRTKVK